jgi:tetratricopeptide (TPR) repeat protein
MQRAKNPGRVGRLVGPLVMASMLALGATGCSDDGGSSPDSGAVASDAKKANTALNAGLESHAEGDLTAAAADYEKTLKHDPKNKFAHYNLALIDEASGNYGLAEEKYRKALESDPAYAPALFNLAILVTGSDPKEAISLYEKVVDADPKDASAWMNLGLLLRASGDEAAGNDAVQKAVELNPELTDPAA